MASTLSQTTAVTKRSEGVYSAEAFGDDARMGNTMPIAFGGIAISQAVSAGWDTLPPAAQKSDGGMHLYSVQGTYLSAASIHHATTFRVESLRTTRSFCSRLVIASQSIPISGIPGSPVPSPGSASSPPPSTSPTQDRRILVVLLDWHAPDNALFTYSSPPIHNPPPPHSLVPHDEYYAARLHPKVHAAFRKQFGLALKLFEYRPCPSMGSENALGILQDETSQSREPMHRRTSSSWVRAVEELDGAKGNAAAVAFLLDAALSFLPLTVHSLPLTSETTSACSSLDFSLRFFSPPDITQWHHNEHHTEHASGGRTFSVGRLYDQKGVEVACMSQMSILRPPTGKLAKL